MTRPASLPSHLHGAAFRVGDLEFHGATPGRLRAADLQRPFRGIRSLGLEPGDLLDLCRAYEPLLRSGEAFSHATAAALHGLPLPSAAPKLHVTAPNGFERARSRGVVGHTTSGDLPIILHHGLPVVAPALTWCQLAAELSPADLVALGDAIVTGRRTGARRAAALATPAELHDELARWGSRRGARKLASALRRVRVGAESRPETHLRLLLVDAGLPEPIPNDPTHLINGEVLHPDLKYVEWRIVLEYQGDRHRTDRERWQADIRRKRAFERSGWRVIEVSSDDLYVDPASLIARVRELIALATA